MRTEEAAGFLYLENRTAHDVEILDNKIVAPKNKSIEHGYGLKNVAAILENINALYVFDYNSQKHLFSFSAQFPISRWLKSLFQWLDSQKHQITGIFMFVG